MTHIVIHTDGGSRGNPGPSAAGIFLPHDGTRIGVWLGDDKTNNDAEYLALIGALSHALHIGAQRVEIRADSQLMVRQMNLLYSVRSETLRALWERAQQLAMLIPGGVMYTYVPRAQNADADAIANEIMDRVAAGENIQCFEPQTLSSLPSSSPTAK